MCRRLAQLPQRRRTQTRSWQSLMRRPTLVHTRRTSPQRTKSDSRPSRWGVPLTPTSCSRLMNVVSFSRAYWSSLKKSIRVSLWYQQASQDLGCSRVSFFGGSICATPIPCAGPHSLISSEQLTLSAFCRVPLRESAQRQCLI